MTSLEQLLRHIKVKNKILLVVLTSIIISLLTSITLFLLYDRQSFRENLIKELTILSDVIAKRSSAALLFKDKKAAQANLNSLSVKDTILTACIYNEFKQVFTHYDLNADESPCPTLSGVSNEIYTEIQGDELNLINPIQFGSRQLGWIYISASMRPLKERTAQLIVVGSIIFLISGLISYLVAVRVQRYITQPITNLQHILRTITRSKDYSLRAKQESTDEIGSLVQDFNTMLHAIQEANMRLTDAAEELKSQKLDSDSKAEGAEERTQAIKEFFAGVSHDLKQPLSAINLFAGVLQTEHDAVKRASYIQKLQESSNNLSALFEELLDMSKIESIMKNINQQCVQLKPLLEKIIKDVEMLAADKHLKIRTHLLDVEVYTDPIMMERVIRNLLANAIRYTEQGGILLATRRVGQSVSIEVWDTGIGIKEDELNIIFERYTQLNNPENKSINGFGLGLSIVSRLTDALDHQVRVFSRYGRGTVFKVRAELYDAFKARNTARKEMEAPNPFAGKHAIIIDDEPDIAEAMLAATESLALKSHAFTTIEQLKQNLNSINYVPDIVLTDYRLSEAETGLHALELIEEYFDKPVAAIVITGEKDQAVIDDIRYYGCHYLAKPIDLKILKNKINEALNISTYT